MALTQVQGGMLQGSTNTTTTIQSNGTTAITIDSSQNVGIGTTTPSNKLSVVTASGSDGLISVKSPTTDTAGVLIDGGSTSNKGALLTLAKDGTTKWRIGLDSAIGGGTNNNLNILGSSTDALLFGTNATERMRITSGGDVGINNTGLTGCRFGVSDDGSVRNAMGINNTASGSTSHAFVSFQRNTTQTGTISNTNSATAYNTSSDYRLKENIAPMTGALATVAQLKPVTYTWKIDGSAGQGFIAHELQAVVPDAVTGEKNAVELVDVKDEEGNVIGQEERPVYQGVDTSFLVATLTAAIQELKAELDTVKAEVAALKAAP